MQRTITLILVAVLLAGCTGARQQAPAPAAPAPVVPESAPATAPVSTAARTEPLPRLDLSQVRYVNVSAPRPESPLIRLHPEEQGALIQALLAALNQAGAGRLRDASAPVRLQAALETGRSGEGITLSLPETDTPVETYWNGQPLYIDSPELKRALEALEPELAARAQKPGIRVWAVDPAGKQVPELLWEQAKPLRLDAVSPDGRYLLLVDHRGEYKGDLRAVPYLLDRTTGTLQAGRQTDIRFAVWSGKGFYIDWLAHLDLQLQEIRFRQLATVLGLKERERTVISVAYSPDGRRQAALVGKDWGEDPLDLVLAHGDGDRTYLNTIPHAISGHATQMGTYARVAWSPDGQWLALTGKDGAALVRVADPAPEKWIRIKAENLVADVTWAPDSQHFWYQGAGVYDLTGARVHDRLISWAFVWHSDSGGAVVNSYDGVATFRLGGPVTDLKAPDFTYPVAFLPDGRLLVARTVYSR